MSAHVTIRLRPHEVAALDEIVASDVTGAENRSELFRLLLHRESNRRRGLDKPKSADWQTAHRNGRESKKNFRP